MDLNSITPVILTFNEELNIGRTLDALNWAREVVVVDSFSTDRTLEIISRHPNVRLVQRKFDSHAVQWNFAVDQVTGSAWVLALDADYQITAALRSEIEALRPTADLAGYTTKIAFCVNGQRLRSSVYPDITTLFRVGRARYIQTGHSQLLKPDGPVITLREPVLHDDRKPFARWLESQQRYAALEAQKIRASRWSDLHFGDKVRSLIAVAPIAMFLRCYLVRLGFLDGHAGLYYATQRMLYECLVSLRLMELSQSGQ